MDTRIVATIHNLKFNEHQLKNKAKLQVNIDGFHISSDFDLLQKNFFIQHFPSMIGTIGMSDLMNEPFIYKIEKLQDLLVHTKSSNPFELSRKYILFLDAVLFSLWFIKDNSAYLDRMYFNHDGTVHLQYSNNRYYNCHGGSDPVSFNDLELFEFSSFWMLTLHYLEGTGRNPMTVDLGKNNPTPFKHFNRLQRALSFLHDARESNMLPKKTTYYIALLESLFTTTSTELTHKVSERVALFIGGTSEEKSVNYEIVKEAYKVRSRYMHGDTITQKEEDLKKVASESDNLVRRILRKIMMDGYKIFTDLKDSDGDKKVFEKYFDQLVFGNELKEGIYKHESKLKIHSIPVEIK